MYYLYNYLNDFQMRVDHIFAHSSAQLVVKPIGHPSMRQENRSKQPRSQPVYLKIDVQYLKAGKYFKIIKELNILDLT